MRICCMVENCVLGQFDSTDSLEPFESIFIGSTALAPHK